MKKTLLKTCALIACSVCLLTPAWAHKASDAYLVLSQDVTTATAATDTAATALRLQLSLAVKDLDAAIDTLDADTDRSLTWGELKTGTPSILAFINQGLELRCANINTSTTWQFASLEQRSDGAYVRLATTLACPTSSLLAIDYLLFKGIDATHRLVVSGQLDGQAIAAVLAPEGRANLTLREPRGAGSDAKQSGRQLAQTGPATLAHFFPEIGRAHV